MMIDRLKKWAFSLQGKFILVASLCLLVFTTIGNLIVLTREEKLYRQDLIHQGKVIAEISRLTLTNVMVYHELGIMDNHDLVDYLDYYIMNLMDRDERVRYIVILDTAGKVLSHNDISEFGKKFKDKSIEIAIENYETDIVYEENQADPILRVTTPLNIDTKSWGVLQIGLSAQKVHDAINILKIEVTAITAVFSALALIIISVGARILAKPVKKLSRIMDGIRSHGDFEQQDYRLKDRRDEIGKLQNSFLWMLKRLRDADRESRKTFDVLRRTEKMVSIGRLAAGVAHEINNPLSGVTLCFKKVIKNDIDERKKRQLTEAITEGFRKIKNIVDQLLDFSRAQLAEKKPIDPNTLIEKVLLLLKYKISKNNVRIIKDFADKVPNLLIDENKMSQVLMNIMLNAIYTMNGGGDLTIKTHLGNGTFVISIADTGIGIPTDIMPNIFDPFFTTKGIGEGTGLGLSVSKGIVEQHGGSIDVKSQAGVGTTFRIQLPISNIS